MNYQTFDPSQDLQNLIKCYWTLEGPKEEVPERQTIVPDGCMELIFHYGDRYKQYLENDTSIVQPRSFVFGQLTHPLIIEPIGITGIFSVRFHPHGFLPFTAIPLKKMENAAVTLEKVFGVDGSGIQEKILKASSTAERIELIESFLLKRLIDTENIDRLVKSTVDTILTANGQLTVDELSKQMQVNRRQLERKFLSTIGLSPKKLSKTVRLQTTLNAILNNSYTSLTDLAYENDYYDQAHFIKDFKELTGFTPKEFYGNKLKMSSLFYKDE